MEYLAKKTFKEFLLVGNRPQNGAHPIKSKNLTPPKIGMWGVLPEAMGWNIGAVHSDFHLGERIWRSGRQRANLKVHSEMCPLGANFPDTLTEIKIWMHSANVPGHWPLDRHPTCLCLSGVNCSLFNEWAPIWGQFPTRKNSFRPFFGLISHRYT